MNEASYRSEKPGMVSAIAIMTLISGILNIILGVSLAIFMLIGVITIFCIPLTAYPIVLGVLEIVYAAKLLPTPPKPVKPAQYLAIMEICNILFLSIWSLVVGILALVFYNDPAVKEYFERTL